VAEGLVGVEVEGWVVGLAVAVGLVEGLVVAQGQG
jgi:hypothetical protein